MKKSLALALALTMLLSLISVAYGFGPIQQVFPIFAQPSAETGEAVNETPQLWFVEFNGAPTADGGRLPTIALEQRNFRAEAATANIKFTERYSFHTLWNGVSIAIAPGQLPALTRLSSVKALYPVDLISIPETQMSATPEMFTALSMTGADIAQSELGYTGKNVKVAIMDTGIDYMHPDLGGGFGPEFRVLTGWDFVGDDFNAADPDKSTPYPDDDPMDVNGHGTHVAGIVGANGVVIGVAPDVQFGAYKVFGTVGSTTADIMLAAMERVLADRMDILNMSIGSAFQWPNYPTAQAADRLVNRGVVVVASIGNSGASGLYSAGAPGLGEKVIGVASFDNTHVALNTFTISPDDYSIGYANAAAAPLAPLSGSAFIMASKDLTGAPPDGESYDGKVAIVARGVSSFYDKALNAQNAGASALIIYNNAAGRFSPTVAGPIAITIPVVAITQADGLLIVSRLAANPVEMTWTDIRGSFINPTGGLISSFSSYGLSPDLTLKPDIGAPGGSVYSTYPTAKGSYATLSGTSMSSPHVAGAVALLLEAKPNTPVQAVRGILQNSADPKRWWGNPGLGFLDNVHRQGAGMLDIAGAITAQTLVTPGKLSLGEGEAGPHVHTLSVANKSNVAVTYDLSYVNALSTGGVRTPGFFGSSASVGFSVPSLTVPAKGTASVVATVHPATGPVNGQYGGYIVLTPQGGGQTYRVPYAGFVGDYQAIQVLTPTASGFPRLGRSSNGINFVFAGAGAVFTMEGYDVPYILAHFEHQSQLVVAEVFEASGKPWQKAFEFKYFTRNSTATGFFAFPWDGYTLRGKNVVEVPNGDYYIVLRVLKALGDKDNPEHWETWTSPTFSIERPDYEPEPPGGKPPVPPGQGKK